MPKTDKRVDAYIARSPEFARPILTSVRAMVHEGAPEAEETLKWGHPTFVQDGILCGMAAFKEYCAIHFWKSALVFDGAAQTGVADALGRLTGVKQLPARRTFIGYVKRAVKLNASGVKVPRPPAKPKKVIAMPDDLRKALLRDARARAAFDGFSPSHQREYLEWIVDAKQEATRARRVAQAVEWMAEGKPRNWKYMKK